jgi:GH35 family endo-1,4-beta-xylanase
MKQLGGAFAATALPLWSEHPVVRRAVRGPSPQRDDTIAWAKSNIPKVRQRDVELRVVDRAGAPVSGLPVEVVQQRHCFPFGDMVWGLDAMHRAGKWETDRARYWRKRFSEVFNSATALFYWTERPRNDASKTEDWQGHIRLDNVAAVVDWARSEGLTVKGHPLFWTVPKAVPDWLEDYDYETQKKFVEVRIRRLVARFRDKISLYDVVNETLWEPSLRHLPQRDWPHIEPIDEIVQYVAPALRWAREEDPEAQLLINDYGLSQGPTDGPPVTDDGTEVTPEMQRRRYLQLARALVEEGAPPDALGLQSHTGGFMEPAEQRAFYDEMAAAGLPLHITEFAAYPEHLEGERPREEIDQLYADYVEDYMTVAFAHPAVEAFYFWGLFRGAIDWDEEGSGHELRPLYRRVRRLIHEEWHTQERLTTDSDGRLQFRGFYGEYALRYSLGRQATDGVSFAVDRQQSMPLRVEAPFG